MQKLAVLAILFITGCAPVVSPTTPGLLERIDNLSLHLDRLTLSLDRITPQTQKPGRVVCRDKKLLGVPQDDKKPGDIEVGMPEKCPAPNEDQACFKGGVFVNTMESRCQAGKL